MSTAHVGWAVGGGLMAVAIAAATTWSAGAHPAPEHVVTASSSPSVTATSPAAASSSAPSSPAVQASSAASSAAASSVAATAVASASAAASGKVIPPAMTPAQLARTTAELAAVARRLPTSVTLTAPAAWASWTGDRPQYAQDVDGCPRISDRLGASLGGHWSYWQGTLPTGPYGCYWTTIPLVASPLPQDKVVVTIGYQHGSLPDVLTGSAFCSGGVEAPRVPVPAVRPGAVLLGCDDVSGPGFTLAVPDTGGTGVFFLSGGGGTEVSSARASAALLAVLSAARHAYAG